MFGCEKAVVLEDNIFAYNTLISIKLFEGEEENVDDIKDIFNLYNKLADYNNTYTEINNICSINNDAYNDPLVIGDDLYEMITTGIDYYEYTNGYYNIAIGSASFKWKTAIENEEVINLDNELENIDIEDIVLNEDNKTVFINNSYTKIDLGGMAKGYALSKVNEYLISKDINKYIINAGESSLIVGIKNENDNYKIGLKDPINSNKTFDIIEEKDKALSVSGDYQNYFDYEGLRYHHILNPKNLSIPRYYKAVTLIGEDSLMLDILSTAVFSLDYTEALELVEKAKIRAIFYVSSEDIRRVDYEEA